MFGENVNIRIGGPLTPVVKKLMIINGVVFLSQQIVGLFYPNLIESIFGLHHVGFAQEFKLWQVVTYMFLHGGWFHIIFNLLGLWMFAGELEQIWGGILFLRYYLITGIGAGLCIAFMNYYMYAQYHIDPVTIGASGAIYGILLAYGLTWPNRQVMLYFIIPVKIKYLVAIFGMIEFFGTLSTAAGTGGNISHIGHLGGILCGLIYLLLRLRRPAIREYAGEKTGDNFILRILKKARVKNKKKEIEKRIQAKKVIDELLEKIARHGMSSLSPQEKKNLEWARKNYYPDRDETLH
jgi:membrane associated rhomboid family serine protease